MRAIIEKICATALVLALACAPTASYASQESGETENQDIGVSVEDFSPLPTIEGADVEFESSLDLSDAVTDLEVDADAETIDISNRLRRRSISELENNPIVTVNGQLTTTDALGMHLFTVTEDKYLIARLDADCPNSVVWLCVIDWTTGTVMPTNIISNSGSYMQLSNLPTGSYALVVECPDTLDVSYTLNINASNPAGPTAFYWNSSDLQYIALRYSSGDIYANGKFAFNRNTTNFNWTREHEVNWGSGYESRTHKVTDVVIQSMSSIPYRWRSSYASSDCAILINLDVGTRFTHTYSTYQSGGSHTMSFYDCFGKKTPRLLDDTDMLFNMVLVYDINTNKVIDFYSELNVFYYSGGETASWTPLF